MFCRCFIIYLKNIFNDFRQINYLNLNTGADLRRMFRVGRTTAEVEQSEISLSVPQGTLARQPILIGFYRSMLCIRGTSRRLVSVCLSHKVGILSKRLNESSWVLACELLSTRPILC